MAFTKIEYLPGDVLTAEKMNEIQDAIIVNEGNIEVHIDDKNNPHSVTAEQIGAALSNHNHDDRYYTDAEVNNLLNTKANTSHGNHVPTTESANNARFLRNDNTWQNVTPANIGASATGHKHTKSEITDLKTENWTFTLEDGSTVTKAVYVG